MSMGGSKTQTVQLPDYVEEALRDNINRATETSRIGYMPYYGPTVAAFTPGMSSAVQNTNALAQQYGMATPQSSGGMPTRDFDGMAAYTSGDLFDYSTQELQRRRPGQYEAMMRMFIDPQTGARSQYDQGLISDELISKGVSPENAAIIASGGDSTGMVGQNNMSYENLTKMYDLLDKYPTLMPGGILARLGEFATGKAIDSYNTTGTDDIYIPSGSYGSYSGGGSYSTGSSKANSGASYTGGAGRGSNPAGHGSSTTGRSDGGYGW